MNDTDYKQIIDDTLKRLKVGYAYRLHYGKKNPNNKLMHIRAIVDGDIVVVCYHTGKRWRYTTTTVYMFYLWFRDGELREAGKSRGFDSQEEAR